MSYQKSGAKTVFGLIDACDFFHRANQPIQFARGGMRTRRDSDCIRKRRMATGFILHQDSVLVSQLLREHL
jgi:hypothetical protein